MLYPYLMSAEEIREISAGKVAKDNIYTKDLKSFAKKGLFATEIFGGSEVIPHVTADDEWDAMEKGKAIPFGKSFGHIELGCPVLNVLFLEEAAKVLSMDKQDLERVVYYAGYVLLEDCNGRKRGEIVSEKALTEDETLREVAGIGAAAIQKLLKDLHDDQHPENMILSALPVIPPCARPYYFFTIDGDDKPCRPMTSDANTLYRLILTRNRHLTYLEGIGAPAIILRNERRLLQEHVDALLANGKRGLPKKTAAGKPLFSISDVLDGKRSLTKEEKGMLLTGLGYGSTLSGMEFAIGDAPTVSQCS